MRGCIYARESSDDITNAPPIENQIEMGKKIIADKGHEWIDDYVDDGKSGGDWNRKEWNELKDDAAQGRFEFVWVWAQDRIARETEAFRNFYRVLHENKVRIFTGTEFKEITMETTGDMALHTVTALADEMFRKNTSDKVKSVYAHKKKIAEENHTPLLWGRSPAPVSLIELACKIKQEHPELGLRLIARQLPPYALKLRKGEKEPRMKKVSHTWVAWALNKHTEQLPDVKKEENTALTVR